MIKVKRARLLTFSLSIVFIVMVLSLCKYLNINKNVYAPTFSKTQVKNPNSPVSSSSVSSSPVFYDNKMVGVWVPYMDLGVNSLINTEEKFKEKFQNIINESKKHHINTLIVHVRSHGDAMYSSKIFPWSHLLTGIQGANPGFDPLSYMVKASHENGLKFHAWINPLRIRLKTQPEKLSDNNPYFKLGSEKYFISHTDGICYNPAYPEVKKLIVDGVKEIAQNYNVDGIHFDDYFYPEEKNMTSKDCAYEEYLKNSKEKLNLQNWRKQHINALIKEAHATVKSVNSKILFGVSPSGNIKECYEAGADVKLWASENGYIDYLCPQIYWSINFPEMPFEKTANEWKNILKNSKIKLYSGLALYKVNSDLDAGTWKNCNNVLEKELKIIKNLNYDGLILYSWNFLNASHTKEEIINFEEELAKN